MSNNNLLKYKGYFGTVEYSIEDQCLWGKIQFINDSVTYESDSAEMMQKEFEAAVDDYIEFCAEVGKEPEKTMTGSFNVRIGPDLHKQALVRAKSDKVSLNDVMKKAIEQYVCSSAEIHNHVNVNVHKHEGSAPTVTTQTFETTPDYMWKPSKELQHGSH